jgi:hypothetical protein
VPSYVVTIRRGPRVEKVRFDTLSEALAAIEERGRALQDGTGAQAVGGKLMRRIEPVQQVIARLELSGPGACGPGSTSAVTAPARASPGGSAGG